MVCAVEEFGLVVAQILLSWVMPDSENSLCLVTQQPEISHVHGTRTLSLDAAMNDAHRGGVVAVDGGGRLRMPHFLEGKSHNFCFLRVEEEGAKFGFGGGRGNALENCGEGEDCAVEANRASVLGDGAEEKMSPCTAACAGGRQIGRVAVHVQYHVAAVISNYSGGMGGHVVEEGVDAAHGVLGGIALLPRDFSEGNEDRRINGASVI